ncbi:hypothetical protein ATANTOWER_024536 [Ataeniobius toweri]|uniref:Uncharacterized protein n=1 Tax=Ataeniobius toweri TaxID=208326 RepID=A0ABU7ART1_9TELE|nr:hypothetical protein [Ataeniobius toweri]
MNEKDQRSTHHDSRSEQGNICLKEEMKKERMLITVSRGLTPPPQSITEKKEHGKGNEKTNGSDKSSKDNREKHQIEKAESSYSSEDDKSSKNKKLKKKKKKEKKKKKKKD